MTRRLSILVMFAALLSLFGCGRRDDPEWPEGGPPRAYPRR